MAVWRCRELEHTHHISRQTSIGKRLWGQGVDLGAVLTQLTKAEAANTPLKVNRESWRPSPMAMAGACGGNGWDSHAVEGLPCPVVDRKRHFLEG